MSMPTDSPTDYYQSRTAVHEQIAEAWLAQARLISHFRKATFASWVLLFLLGTLGYLSATVGWTIAGVTIAGFLALLIWHELLQSRIELAKQKADIARVQLARLARVWEDIPQQAIEVPSPATNLSDDLDLFGHASLYQLLCRAHTPGGRQRLRDWILQGADPATVCARQEAISCLAPLREFREELDLRGRVLSLSPTGPRSFVEWSEGESWLQRRPWLKHTSRVLVVSLLAAVGLAIVGIVEAPVAVAFCLAVLTANLVLSVLLVGGVHDIFEKVDSRHRDILQYQTLFEMMDQLPTTATLLGSLQQRMATPPSRSADAIGRLAKIMRIAQMRHSGTLGVIHLLLQLIFLIDFHVLVVLESWQARHGKRVRDWFDALGELEALASLASLHHDQASWVLPRLDRGAARFEAAKLGHPLLAEPVRNDVCVGPAGRFLLVSGSNMSGKSTLLRSIALNAILAQAGGPVCASMLTLPPVEIATSMRIQDSLEDGISFFMAELQRLKRVIDHAVRLAQMPDRTLLFLLDEILQGTNSAERHIAVTRVVHRLTECGAMGAISTHDLELADSAELAAICDPVHFRESFSPAGEMTFDYVMRNGVATSTNALKLLEMVGID